MSVDQIITGKLVTHYGVYEKTSIAVKNGKVVGIGDKCSMSDALEEVDVGNLLILPGIVDAHVYSLGDANEGHWNSTSAAAAGGVTTINDHPLDLGGAPTSAGDIEAKAARTASEALVDFSLFAEGMPEKLQDIPDAVHIGITGYKVLMQATSGAASYGVRALDNGEPYAIFELIGKEDQVVMIHAENEWIVNYLIASDHAPHPENHEPNVFDNFSGSPGI